MTDEQVATQIAALRFYQSHGLGNPENRPCEFHELATAADSVISLDDDGIDQFCELLNMDGEPVD